MSTADDLVMEVRMARVAMVAMVVFALASFACGHDESDSVGSLNANTDALIAAEDDARHPQVCAIIANFQSPTGVLVQRCTAVLVAPDVMITQGHCTDPRPNLYNERVTCEPNALQSTRRISYTPVPHPQFNRLTFGEQLIAGIENHDRGVLLLHEAITDVIPAKIPQIGAVDDWAAECAEDGDEGCDVSVVGYGASGVGPGSNSLF